MNTGRWSIDGEKLVTEVDGAWGPELARHQADTGAVASETFGFNVEGSVVTRDEGLAALLQAAMADLPAEVAAQVELPLIRPGAATVRMRLYGIRAPNVACTRVALTLSSLGYNRPRRPRAGNASNGGGNSTVN